MLEEYCIPVSDSRSTFVYRGALEGHNKNTFATVIFRFHGFPRERRKQHNVTKILVRYCFPLLDLGQVERLGCKTLQEQLLFIISKQKKRSIIQLYRIQNLTPSVLFKIACSTLLLIQVINARENKVKKKNVQWQG